MLNDDKDLELLDAIISNKSNDGLYEAFNPELEEYRTFCNKIDLKDGLKGVPLDLIYHLYRDWMEDQTDYDGRQLKAMKKWRFHRYTNKYYKTKIIKNIKLVFVDHVSIGLPENYTFYADSKVLRRINMQGSYLAGVTPLRKIKRYHGVWWDKELGKYVAKVEYEGKWIFIGYFTVRLIAARAYDQASIIYHGREAVLNFPRISKKRYKQYARKGLEFDSSED